MPTDLTPLSALALLAAGILLSIGWHLAADLLAFLRTRAGALWDIIVIIIIIIIIVIIIFL